MLVLRKKLGPFVLLLSLLFSAWAPLACGPVTGSVPKDSLVTPASEQADQKQKPGEGTELLPETSGLEDPNRPRAMDELHRLWIENRRGGAILGSRDGGKTWIKIGKITSPINGGLWYPARPNNPGEKGGVLAFNFLRGPSSVFATAVNALHIRLSDPPGYSLPTDLRADLVEPQGVSLFPREEGDNLSPSASSRAAVTDIPGGQGIFGSEWSPKVGSEVLMGDGIRFAPIARDQGPDSRLADRSVILIRTPKAPVGEIEYLEFDNFSGGQVRLKRVGQSQTSVVARVTQGVRGVGRFAGSEYAPKPGVLRANHAGVICIATTDLNTAIPRPTASDPAELRGGFQVVPSHHYADSSMSSGGDHGEVYLVVAPIQGPEVPVRYDSGVEGTYPMFFQGLRAGTGKTYFKFAGSSSWIEMQDALKQGLFRAPGGGKAFFLRGKNFEAFVKVKGIRFVP